MTERLGWAVVVTGDEADLMELSAHLPGSVQIIQNGPDWELFSERFAVLDDASAIREAAVQLTELLNGMAAIRLESRERITVGGVRRHRAGGNVDVWVFPETATAYFRAFAPTVLINGVAEPPPSWAADLDLAGLDEKVRAVLEFLAINPATWHSLFSALEVIAKDRKAGRETGVAAWGGISDSEIARFNETANSYRAIGTQARHGPKHLPPDTPMTLPEATELVRTVARRWLDKRTSSPVDPAGGG